MSIAAMNAAWQIEELKPAYKFVLMALADAAGDDGYCWPSIPTLARKTGMSERSVQRILRILEKSGLLKVEARFRGDGSATSNGYYLTLIKGGDNLPSPLSQSKHQVVVSPSPPSDLGVTQTTIEPPINLKQPLLVSDVAKTPNGSENYIFPRQLDEKERVIAQSQLDLIDKILAQAVLDELAARLNANKVTGAPLSYLRSLITRAKAGQFMPEAGIRIASTREQAKSEKIKKSAEVIKPRNPKEIPKHLAAMRQVLGRKSTSNLNQKD